MQPAATTLSADDTPRLRLCQVNPCCTPIQRDLRSALIWESVNLTHLEKTRLEDVADHRGRGSWRCCLVCCQVGGGGLEHTLVGADKAASRTIRRLPPPRLQKLNTIDNIRKRPMGIPQKMVLTSPYLCTYPLSVPAITIKQSAASRSTDRCACFLSCPFSRL